MAHVIRHLKTLKSISRKSTRAVYGAQEQEDATAHKDLVFHALAKRSSLKNARRVKSKVLSAKSHARTARTSTSLSRIVTSASQSTRVAVKLKHALAAQRRMAAMKNMATLATNPTPTGVAIAAVKTIATDPARFFKTLGRIYLTKIAVFIVAPLFLITLLAGAVLPLLGDPMQAQQNAEAALNISSVYDRDLSVQQNQLLGVVKAIGWQGSGRCAMWTNKVFQAVTGVHPGCNARDYLTKFSNSRDFDQLQVGMFIAVKSTPYTALSRQYGHVGIYIGDGKVMHNSEKIRIDTLEGFFKFCGGWRGGSGWGWGWANNKPLV